MITSPHLFKISSRVGFNSMHYEYSPGHSNFLGRLRTHLTRGGDAQSLVAEFKSFNPQLKSEIYKSIVARLLCGHSHSSNQVTWWRFEKSEVSWHPYVPHKTSLVFTGQEVEKINVLLKSLEDCLELEHPHGYRFTWTPSKNLMLAGVAREYDYKGFPVRDYLTFEGYLKQSPMISEKIAGFCDQGRIILLYFLTAKEQVSNYFSLLREGAENPYKEQTAALRAALTQIPNCLQQLKPRGHWVSSDIYDPLAHALLREHEYGHLVSFQTDPEIEASLHHSESSLGYFFSACSLSEILADLEGPVAMIVETAKSDQVQAEALFWTLVARTYFFAVAQGGFDIFSRFEKEFMLCFLMDLIAGAYKPNVNFQQMPRRRAQYSSAIYKIFTEVHQLRRQGTYSDWNYHNIKHQAMQLVYPRHMFGSQSQDYSAGATRKLGFYANK